MTEQEWLSSEDPQAMLQVFQPTLIQSEAGDEAGSPRFVISDRKLRLFAAAMWRGHPDILARYGSSELPNLAERQADGLASADEVRAARLTLGVDADGGSLPYPVYVAQAARHLASVLLPGPQCVPENRRQAALLRDIAGNPWRVVTWQPPAYWQTDSGRGGLILSLAYAAYEQRGCPSCAGTGQVRRYNCERRHYLKDGPCPRCAGTGQLGTLDPVRLAILADALEEAGCPQDMECTECRGTGTVNMGLADALCGTCTGRRYEKAGGYWRGSGVVRNPLLAHLRGEGPHVRGDWALDLILGKE